MAGGSDRGPQELFAGFPESLAICQAVQQVIAGLGEASMRTTKSQVAFRRRRGFAYAWRPGQYVASDVPLVLSIALPTRLDSPRFKEVVHPSPKVWMHHLELDEVSEVDDEVSGWLSQAWERAAR